MSEPTLTRDDKPLRLVGPLVRAQQMASAVRGPCEWAMSWSTFLEIWLSVEDVGERPREQLDEMERTARDGRRTLLGWRVHIDDTIDDVKVVWPVEDEP